MTKNGADGAAVEAMRIVLQRVSMDGIVVIGEGEKDEAPMLFNGERIGDGTPPEVGHRRRPGRGTTLTSLGRGDAVSVIAMSERGTMFDPGRCVYMESRGRPRGGRRHGHHESLPTENLRHGGRGPRTRMCVT